MSNQTVFQTLKTCSPFRCEYRLYLYITLLVPLVENYHVLRHTQLEHPTEQTKKKKSLKILIHTRICVNFRIVSSYVWLVVGACKILDIHVHPLLPLQLLWCYEMYVFFFAIADFAMLQSFSEGMEWLAVKLLDREDMDTFFIRDILQLRRFRLPENYYGSLQATNRAFKSYIYWKIIENREIHRSWWNWYLLTLLFVLNISHFCPTMLPLHWLKLLELSIFFTFVNLKRVYCLSQ